MMLFNFQQEADFESELQIISEHNWYFHLKVEITKNIGQVNVGLPVKVMLDHLINVSEMHSDFKQNKATL